MKNTSLLHDLLITGCAQRAFYCSKQTGSSTKETITHHFFVSHRLWARKLSMQPKFVAAQKMLLRNRNPANIRKWIYLVLTLGIYTPLEARVYCSQ